VGPRGETTEVAPGIHRLGSRYIERYLIQESDKFTVLDAGLAAYWDQLPAALSRLGRSLSDIDAVVLTHNHADHVSDADRVRTEPGCVVWIGSADGPVGGDAKPTTPRGFVSNPWRPQMMRYYAHCLRNGGAEYPTVSELSVFSDGEVLDVPGSPRVIHTLGHTAGHSALLLERRGVLFTGDGLVTLDVATGKTGPRLLAVNDDREQARASLPRLEGLHAQSVLPSHGDPATRCLS
jgi:glyoxylase-like metal-dependent hydrolase (beta-lactamase superfamily II)